MSKQTPDIRLIELREVAIDASRKASREILDVYHSGNFETVAKQDHSPLTVADKRAHHVIMETLAATQLPVLSEEGKDIAYGERKRWDYFWMVDPLDGTKEFLKRNDEFTVNIALIHQQKPILGVVAVPVTGAVYAGAETLGAVVIRDNSRIPLSPREPVNLAQPGLRVVASRSHMDERTKAFINALSEPSLVSRGSSLKFMLLAENQADVYPRYAPTMEWDTAAAHAILNQLGLEIYQQDSHDPLQYNKPNLLNPGFICRSQYH
jgi:3'(2'), 5'-bisphosphate nucleotidase